MTEISTVLLTLIIEALVALLVVLLVWVYIAYTRKRKDIKAAKKLVDQVKHQSQTRLEHTGSFLKDKYRFEGNELDRAVKSIDKAEKKFIQILIKTYLKRDADSFASMDASMAEMIDHYKSLSPVMPDKKTLAALEAGGDENSGELERLRKSNASLTRELGITKDTMANMITEFGNMFSGGKVRDDDPKKKAVPEASQEAKAGKAALTAEPDEEKLVEEFYSAEAEGSAVLEQKEAAADDFDIDDLIDGIDLSDDKL